MLKSVSLVLSILCFGTTLNADFLGSGNVARNLASQNNDMAYYSGTQYCSRNYPSVGSYTQTEVVNLLSDEYFPDHQNMIPYKADWLRGCNDVVSRVHR